jgi:hypothetical protein
MSFSRETPPMGSGESKRDKRIGQNLRSLDQMDSGSMSV